MLFQSIQQYSRQFAQLNGDRIAVENDERGYILMGLLGSESMAAFTEKCLADWRLLGTSLIPNPSQPHSHECYEIQPKLFSFVNHHNSIGGKLRQAF